MSHENLLDAEQHAERADAMLYERVGDHACEAGVTRSLSVLRTWFADRAQLYVVASGHRVAYEEVADMLDQMREVVAQAGADRVECSPLATEASATPFGDGT